jgi:hypothetical protein
MLIKGNDGTIEKRKGGQVQICTYLIMEYIPGILLYDLSKELGALGETQALFFFT